ncbi:MAG TPA: pyridoxamine 5'-phosphate oxidase family protein [Rhodoblastus sp.]|nr:pyridoxamine 5'-phosphate oxidase family protein [Rhodoblastus sp.]
MAKDYPSLTPALRDFIARQRIFFAATAAAGTRVNVSPRSTREFRVIGDNEVCWLDLTGSGAETAAHLKADGRLTIMFCAFEGPPSILRLYGRGEILHRDSAEFSRALAAHFDNERPVGTRQIVRLAVDLVKTSCGYGVPAFDYQRERPALDNWADNKGPAGVEAYWREKNAVSMDGLPTGIVE